MSDASKVAGLIEEKYQIDSAITLEAMQNPEVKLAVRTATEAAQAKGVFGAPFFMVNDQPYWGHDRLEHIAWNLSA